MTLYKNTVSNLLWKALIKLQNSHEFQPFRLVGGTALSLQIGHRKSVDIDLFTDAEYGSIDFNALETKLKELFPCVEPSFSGQISMGTSYFVGNNKEELIKLDIFYTDTFVFPVVHYENIRLG